MPYIDKRALEVPMEPGAWSMRGRGQALQSVDSILYISPQVGESHQTRGGRRRGKEVKMMRNPLHRDSRSRKRLPKADEPFGQENSGQGSCQGREKRRGAGESTGGPSYAPGVNIETKKISGGGHKAGPSCRGEWKEGDVKTIFSMLVGPRLR